MSVLSKSIYRFSEILLTCKCYFSQDWNEYFSNLYGTKETPNVQNNVKKKNKVEGDAFHGLKLCYKVLIIKKVKYLHKNRHTKQWIKIESSGLYPLMY